MDDKPDSAPEHCPGTKSSNAGKASTCSGCPNQSVCLSADGKSADPGEELVKAKMSTIQNTILVLSGKGGVGKSTFTNLLARTLASTDTDTKVAVLDIDICGPSQPRMMGTVGEKVHKSGSGWCPLYIEDNLSVMSVGFLLSSVEDAVIWRGPKKNTMIRQFLSEVDWDDPLHYLILDTPPGTSDEHISSARYLSSAGGPVFAVVVTTPSEVSLADVRREISFCVKVGIKILGVIENMAGFVCPKCQVKSDIFPSDNGGGANMASDMGIPFLGSIPLDPLLARACDEGQDVVKSMADSETIIAAQKIKTRILEEIDKTRRL
ncbi:cytosolic Fe-S cluster assembly factor NUBP1 homolog [Cimex lectularius]|uniref:Cytosolic Fe-S cluster assembly factor NUBP1 homolog n=1 Tax=Cimex lectularius TaxID=79782 RepID=A0A8I6RUF9_CIMLE|nr:cytosolic Fe-S cluster assembly factor NUBP1 homolog [Cimex lectularius]